MLIRKPTFTDQRGFTLVEIIAVLIILGILAAVAVPRYIDLQENASNRAIDAAIAELNSRESLAWAQTKIDGATYTSDGDFEDAVWDVVAPSGAITLGDKYTWEGGAPSQTEGGNLKFDRGPYVNLKREVPTGVSPTVQPYVWSRE